MSIINPSLAAFLLPNPPRCVSVSYDRDVSSGRNARNETIKGTDIKSFKTFDTDIKTGDFVIIPTDTRWGFTIGRVEAVDLVVNYSSNEQMRWVGGRMDKAAYDTIIENEKRLTGTVAKATEQKARRELVDELSAIDSSFASLSLTAPVPAEPAPQPEPAHRGGSQADITRRDPSRYAPTTDDDIPF